MYRRFLSIVLFVLFITSLGVAQSILLPTPKYGAYHWNPDYAAWPGTPDRLNWGANLVAGLGLSTIRVEMGFDASGSYGFDPAPTSPSQNNYLVSVALMPQYACLFNDPRFTDYLLTTYTPQAFNRLWGTTGADLELEREEYRQLAVHLGLTYPGKTFILMSWEGDNDLYAYRSKAAQFQAILAQRVLGIRQANMPNVRSGLEINCAHDGQGGICDQALVVRMMPALQPDYLSYSPWVTINAFLYSTDPLALEAQLTSDLEAIITAAGEEFRFNRIMLGESGRAVFQPMPANIWFQALDHVARRKFLPYLIVWQTMDDSNSVLHYGLYDVTGAITENGYAFRQLAQPPVYLPPKKGWPIIR